jgi:hypothetical protein
MLQPPVEKWASEAAAWCRSRQSTAPLVIIGRLSADVRSAPRRTCRHETRGRDLRHDPIEASEARRPRDYVGSARQARIRVELSGCRGVRDGRATIVRISSVATREPEDQRRRISADRTSHPTAGNNGARPHFAQQLQTERNQTKRRSGDAL